MEPTKATDLAEYEARRKQSVNAEPFPLRKARQSFFYNISPLDMKKQMGVRGILFSDIREFSEAVRVIFKRFEFHA